MSEIELVRARLGQYVSTCAGERIGEYRSHPQGATTLYASCFAAMLLHFIGKLGDVSPSAKLEWVDHINSWQNPESGRFVGPELREPESLTSPDHDWEHVTTHLTVHVLPALHLLGGTPTYPLKFAKDFLSSEYLTRWLAARNWENAWLEGNNLLFVGQLLIFLRDVEGRSEAAEALDCFFSWLDEEVDPSTGLWGTNGYCSEFIAMCGAYHQLIVYNHERRPVRFRDRIVDTVLNLQWPGGGFSPEGGACEDADAIDILVNMYKISDYKRPEIRRALRMTLSDILSKQADDGGFVYRWNQPFIHMGISATASPAGVSNMFATWFRVHTFALIAEVLTDDQLSEARWEFNTSCSMGWHRTWDKSLHRISPMQRQAEQHCSSMVVDALKKLRLWEYSLRCFAGRVKRSVFRGRRI